MKHESGIGQLSPRLLDILKKQEADLPAHTERLVNTLWNAIQDYSTIADPSVKQDVYDSCALNVRLWHDLLRSGLAIPPEDLKLLKQVGHRRARQGVPIASVLRALRIGSRLLWEELLKEVDGEPVVAGELLTKVSPYVFFHSDLVAHTMSEAYLEEKHNSSRWHDRLRHNLCGLVFNRPEDIDGFREHTLALGIDGTVPYTALAMRLNGLQSFRSDLDMDDEGHFDPLVDAISRATNTMPEKIMRIRRHGHLMFWLQSGDQGLPVTSQRQLSERIEALIREYKSIAAIGLGLPDVGPQGWHRGAEQALKALELGLRLAPERCAFHYADLAIEDLIAGTENVARYFSSLLEPLASEPELLETLRTYLQLDQQRKRAASALKVHPNTLIYRLRRLETLLGLKLSDTPSIATLHIALRLRRLNQPAGSDTAATHW